MQRKIGVKDWTTRVLRLGVEEEIFLEFLGEWHEKYSRVWEKWTREEIKGLKNM